MIAQNAHQARKWAESARSLVDVAMGRVPCDVFLKNGKWVCVQSGEIIPGSDIAIKGERIAYVGADGSHTIGDNTCVIDAGDRYLVPGLLDGHTHVESSLLTVTEYVRAVLPHGTTGIFIDPHEIANVLGMEGVRLVVDEAAQQPIHVWVQMPSCVPSAPTLETSGASLGPEDVREAMSWEGIIGLGEVMSFASVADGDPMLLAEHAATRAAGKVIGGHFASLELDHRLHAYAAAGPEDDHEGTRLEDAVARLRLGMKVMMRYGSAMHDVAEQVRAATELGLETRHLILVTDACHSGTLVEEGHMDRVVKHAVEVGVPPMMAIQMATINTASHFGLARDMGQIAPGRYGDILIVGDVNCMDVDVVIARGKVVAQDGLPKCGFREFRYPSFATSSVQLRRSVTANDFILPASGQGTVMANVIGVVENQAPTLHLRLPVQINGGEVRTDTAIDLAKVAVLERHHGTGTIQVGLVQGFGLRFPCAFGSTIAHDAHQMVIVGSSESSMAIAANELARLGGGQIVVLEDVPIAAIGLPIAGLMSRESAEIVAQKAEELLQAMRLCGCTINNPNMQLTLLPLVTIPALRLSDRGLVDVEKQELIPVIDGN